MEKFFFIVILACVAASPIDDVTKTTAVEPVTSPTTQLDTASTAAATEVKPTVNVPAQEALVFVTEAKPIVNHPEASADEGQESGESDETNNDGDDLNTDSTHWRRRKYYPVRGYYQAVPRFYGPQAYFGVLW